MEKVAMTIEEYLEILDAKHRPTLEELIKMVQQVAPTIDYAVWQGAFWGGSQQTILGFGDMDYETKSGEKGKWFKLGLSRQKNYYSLYISAVKDGQYLLKNYKDKLGKAKVGASNVSFTKLENLDLGNLKELFNVSLNEA